MDFTVAPKYPKYRELLAEKGFEFTGVDRTRDVYYRNENERIELCEPCNVLKHTLNGKPLMIKLNARNFESYIKKLEPNE